jgi:hypothetical protein
MEKGGSVMVVHVIVRATGWLLAGGCRWESKKATRPIGGGETRLEMACNRVSAVTASKRYPTTREHVAAASQFYGKFDYNNNFRKIRKS